MIRDSSLEKLSDDNTVGNTVFDTWIFTLRRPEKKYKKLVVVFKRDTLILMYLVTVCDIYNTSKVKVMDGEK